MQQRLQVAAIVAKSRTEFYFLHATTTTTKHPCYTVQFFSNRVLEKLHRVTGLEYSTFVAHVTRGMSAFPLVDLLTDPRKHRH